MEEFAKFPGMDPIPVANLKDHHIETSTIRCTACWTILNINNPSDIKQHPDLKTIICKKCFNFYGSGNFSQDEDGDKYCRVCAEGGRLIGCDFCKNVFCDKCISQNFGRKERTKIKEASEWKCYACQNKTDQNPLQPLVNASVALMNYIERKSKPKVKNSKFGRSSKGRSLDPDNLFDEEMNSTSDDDKKDLWLQKHFSSVVQSFDNDKRQIMKLKSKLKNHCEVPRRVLRCSEKLFSHLKQHIQDCEKILSVLALDNEKKKLEVASLDLGNTTLKSSNDTVLIDVDAENDEPAPSQSLLVDLHATKSSKKTSVTDHNEETEVLTNKSDKSVLENGISESLSDIELLPNEMDNETTIPVLEKSITKEIEDSSMVHENKSPKSKSGSDDEKLDDDLEVRKKKMKEKRKQKLSLTYRKKHGSSSGESTSTTPVKDIQSSSENSESTSTTPIKDITSENGKSVSKSSVKDVLSTTLENDEKSSKNLGKESKNESADLKYENTFLPKLDQLNDVSTPVKNLESLFAASTPKVVNSNVSSDLFDDEENELNNSNLIESVINGLSDGEQSNEDPLQRDLISKESCENHDKELTDSNSCDLFNSTLEKKLYSKDAEIKSLSSKTRSHVQNYEESAPSSKLELEDSDDADVSSTIPNTRKLKKETSKANEIAKKKLAKSLLSDSSDSDSKAGKSQKSRLKISSENISSDEMNKDTGSKEGKSQKSKLKISLENISSDEMNKDTGSKRKKLPKKSPHVSSENELDANTEIKANENENEKSEGILSDLDMVVEETTPIDNSLATFLSNDVKIQSKAVVNIRRLDPKIITKFEEGEIKNLNDGEDYDSDIDIKLLDSRIARLAELPSKKVLTNGPKRRSLTVKVSPKRKPVEKTIIKILETSDSDSESSDHDTTSVVDKSKLKFFEADDDVKVNESLNSLTKKCLLNDSDDSDGSVSSLDSGKNTKDEATKKASRKLKLDKDGDSSDSKSVKNENEDDDDNDKENKSSDEDFIIKKKRPKYDKLLNLNLDDSSNSGSVASAKSNSNKNAGNAKNNKKSTKRKIVLLSDNSDSASDSSSISSIASLQQDKTKKKKPAAKKRKRIKQISNSSDSDSDVKEVDSDGGTQSTPTGKGRKKIRKIVGEDNLDKATKKAALAEKERRKRVQDRQKYYNTITEGTTENGDLVTRKLVLEVHKESKEELVEVPEEVLELLKPHQVNGVKFMWECVIESLEQLKDKKGAGCVLAHCMGLGKTLQCIAFLVTLLKNDHINKHIKRAMIVCPYNTILNWANEFKIWLKTKDLKINVFEMTNAKSHYDRADLLEKWHRKGGAMILSYESFRNLTQEKSRARIPKKVKERYLNCLVDPGPDIVICDEGHILKNASSAIAKAMGRIRTGRRVVLTGTPLQNNLKEYHTMVHFVKPHLVGTEKEFKNRFVNPINNGQCADSTPQDVKLMKKRVHILHKLLEGCVQRCDYGHVSKFLPPKHEYVLSIKLSEKQIALYSQYLGSYAMNKDKGVVIQNGTQLFKDFAILRLIWTHPLLMKMQKKRDDEKALKEELNDDESSMGSFIDDRSEPSEDSDEDLPKPSTSKSKKKDESDSESAGNSSTEEVISKWKTKKRGTNADTDESEAEPEVVKEALWWEKIVPEEEINKIELSGKMVLLFEILKECSAIGDKVLIFSQSLLTLNLIEELLTLEDSRTQEISSVIDESIIKESIDDKITNASRIDHDAIGSWSKGLDYFRMDGSTPADLRKRWTEIFNDNSNERARVFLISTKAGSLGTNLIGANRVIIMDASWNPTHDVQAIFRVYRFGQTKPVYIYRFLAQGTMEEKIYDRQVTKQSLSCRVVDEQQIERHFNAADLAELYSFSPESTSKRPTPIMPKDRLLADMLFRHKGLIVSYHEHDSLLQNLTDEDLTEEERKAAWQEYENEREGINQITNEFGNQATGPLPTPENIIASIKTKYPSLDDPTILKIFMNYIGQAQKKKQEAVSRAHIFLQAQQSIPIEISNEISRYNNYVHILDEFGKKFRDQINQRSRFNQFQQANLYQQEQVRQAQARFQAQAQAQARFQAQAQAQAQFQYQMRYNAQQFQARMQRPTFSNNQQNVGNSYAARNYSRMNENLAKAGNANNIHNISKLLGDLQKRNVDVGLGQNVIIQSPDQQPKRSQPKRGGPKITEITDPHPSLNQNDSDNNPLITEVD